MHTDNLPKAKSNGHEIVFTNSFHKVPPKYIHTIIPDSSSSGGGGGVSDSSVIEWNLCKLVTFGTSYILVRWLLYRGNFTKFQPVLYIVKVTALDGWLYYTGDYSTVSINIIYAY